MAAQGPKDAPITIVEYSDFECPYCSRGYRTIQEVKEKYKGKIRFVFKHLPLDFHPMAMPAAQYFEAIALQSPEKAYKFHDYVFENQDKLKTGKEKFLDEAARKAGADLAKVKTDMKSDTVMKRIEADMEEAKQFGISGTPGFIINGVSLRGAYPADKFAEIIDRQLKQ
jgi:protein-disulfide isomerase